MMNGYFKITGVVKRVPMDIDSTSNISTSHPTISGGHGGNINGFLITQGAGGSNEALPIFEPYIVGEEDK